MPDRRLALISAALLAVGALAAPAPTWRLARAAEPVDLLLVLAADVSRSIDEEKFALQRQGYAAALSDARVIRAIKSGPNGRVAIALVEWSGPSAQAVIVDWTLVADEVEARALADRVRAAPRLFMERTAIGAAIDYSMRQFERSPYAAPRHVIDVSGDGTSNAGRSVVDARADALARGVTINGLVILSATPMPGNPTHTHPPGGLKEYYENNVAGGPGSFVIAAEGFESFETAIASKLVKEIAGRDDGTRAASAHPLRRLR